MVGIWRALVAVALLANSAILMAEERVESCPQARLMDSERLEVALKEQGFVPGDDFKALVIEIEKREGCGLLYRYYDYRGTAGEGKSWWPASTVKILAAVAALERLHSWGFGPTAKVTFEYSEANDGPVTFTVAEIVRAAITPSDNVAYDRLVEIVGYEWLNDSFLSDAKGLGASILQRGYGGRHRYADSGRGSLRHAPQITILEGKRKRVLLERSSAKTYNCPNQGNCVPLRDLAECLRRVMLHEELPAHERFELGPAELALLRSALAGKRKRGLGVVNGLKSAFGNDRLRLHHKAGFALKWFSDNVFVEDKKSGRRWLVALANRPGREALDEAALHLGIILRDNVLHQELP
jgi:hypothetical protein